MGTRFVRVFRAGRWSDKLSIYSVVEGDVFALFEDDGKRVTTKTEKGILADTFIAKSAPYQTGGVGTVEAEICIDKVPPIPECF